MLIIISCTYLSFISLTLHSASREEKDLAFLQRCLAPDSSHHFLWVSDLHGLTAQVYLLSRVGKNICILCHYDSMSDFLIYYVWNEKVKEALKSVRIKSFLLGHKLPVLSARSNHGECSTEFADITLDIANQMASLYSKRWSNWFHHLMKRSATSPGENLWPFS